MTSSLTYESVMLNALFDADVDVDANVVVHKPPLEEDILFIACRRVFLNGRVKLNPP